MTALLLRLSRSAATARSLRELRRRALALIAREVDHDAALFHALSPRVPLDTAVVVGLEMETVLGTVPTWDRLAVELGRLADVARNAGGVATDDDAFPPRTRGRARFDALVSRKLGVRHMLIAHLVVRDAIRSAVLLFRRQGPPFDARDKQAMRQLVPILAIADTLHVELDGVSGEAAGAASLSRSAADPQAAEIVELVAFGHTNAAIAEALGVSPNTLRNHLAEIFRRLGAANRADVVRIAVLAPEHAAR